MSRSTRTAAGAGPSAIRLLAITASPLRSLLLVLTVALASGCVPVPYRPSASVTPVPVVAGDAPAMVLTTDDREWLKSVEKSIQKADPRVTIVDSTAYLRDAAPSGTGTDLLAPHASATPTSTVDVVLSVGTPRHRVISDKGMAGMAPMFPGFIVGFEKVHQTEQLSATLVDIGRNDRSEAEFVLSDYTEVTAGLAYGFATIAMPESAVRKALVDRVVLRLHEAQPTGAVRLVVVHQDDYLPRKFAEQALAAGASADPGMPPHGPTLPNTFRAEWELADVGCYERNKREPMRTGEFGLATFDDTGIELSRAPSGPPTATPLDATRPWGSHVAFADLLPVAQVQHDGWVALRRTDGSCVHIRPKSNGPSGETGDEAADFADAVRWQVARVSPATVATNP
jgi:hypothetical protein